MSWPTAAARSGLSRIALRTAPTGERTMRSAIDDADEVADGEERIHRPAGGEVDGGEAEIEAGRRHAGQAVLAAGPVGQRIDLDEVEHLADRHRDHGEVDAGAAQRDQADQAADHRRARPCRSAAPADATGSPRASAGRRRRSRRCRRTPPGRTTAGRCSRTGCRSRCRTGPRPGCGSPCSARAEMRQHEGRDEQSERGQQLGEVSDATRHHRPAFIRVLRSAQQAVRAQHAGPGSWRRTA